MMIAAYILMAIMVVGMIGVKVAEFKGIDCGRKG